MLEVLTNLVLVRERARVPARVVGTAAVQDKSAAYSERRSFELETVGVWEKQVWRRMGADGSNLGV